MQGFALFDGAVGAALFGGEVGRGGARRGLKGAHAAVLLACVLRHGESIASAVGERCPNAVRCVDPFHVIALATDALDEIRREVWNQARRAGHKQAAKELKGARFVLWKNPGKLTERQKIKLAQIQQTNKPLYRAYLISQQLRDIYRVTYQDAIELLDAWLAWARRCRLAPFVKLAKTITKQRPGNEAAIQHGLSNARIEQVNTQLRLITRRAYGFRTPEALIALAMLSLGGLCPLLPT